MGKKVATPSSDFKIDFHENSSWGTFDIGLNCYAVYVGISLVYTYLDIDAFARKIRIARNLSGVLPLF